MTLVKICGLMRPEDLEAVNEARPDFAGFILTAGFRRTVEAGRARELAAALSPGIRAVGVFVDDDAARIAELVEEGVISVVQLHGSEDDTYIADLRMRLAASGHGSTQIVKAFKIRGADDVAAANTSAADLVLLDNGQGTGKTFDWSRIQGIERPYFLAGGLGPGNVADAVAQLHPHGVDMSSGVETDGHKDPAKIAAAVQAARATQRR